MCCIVPTIALSLFQQIKKMNTRFIKYLLLAAIVMVMTISNAKAQQQQKSSDPALFAKIAQLDSLVFDALNKRDTTTFKNFFSKDLEFFHDKGGLTGYDHTINFLKSLLENKSDLRRDLVKGSLEVYPVPGYGAMQIGSHQFCHTENGKYGCATFKFVHVWQNKDGQWKITRVISYDH